MFCSIRDPRKWFQTVTPLPATMIRNRSRTIETSTTQVVGSSPNKVRTMPLEPSFSSTWLRITASGHGSAKPRTAAAMVSSSSQIRVRR